MEQDEVFCVGEEPEPGKITGLKFCTVQGRMLIRDGRSFYSAISEDHAKALAEAFDRAYNNSLSAEVNPDLVRVHGSRAEDLATMAGDIADAIFDRLGQGGWRVEKVGSNPTRLRVILPNLGIFAVEASLEEIL